MRRRRSPEAFNFWPSLTDMMTAAFMITLLLWFTERLMHASLPVADPREHAALVSEVEELQRQLTHAHAENARLLAEVARLNDRPPILNLPEAEGFRFDSGSAELSPDFSRRLEGSIIPKLDKFCLQYESQIDTLEIIGHTDGQGVAARGGRNSHLDDLHAGEDQTVASVPFRSNADLGLLRALEIAHRMRLAQAQGRLPHLEVRAYSAAQLILPDYPAGAAGPPTGDTERRRIEIRLTKLKPSSNPTP